VDTPLSDLLALEAGGPLVALRTEEVESNRFLVEAEVSAHGVAETDGGLDDLVAVVTEVVFKGVEALLATEADVLSLVDLLQVSLFGRKGA
jgi:hypothetical protein